MDTGSPGKNANLILESEPTIRSLFVCLFRAEGMSTSSRGEGEGLITGQKEITRFCKVSNEKLAVLVSDLSAAVMANSFFGKR